MFFHGFKFSIWFLSGLLCCTLCERTSGFDGDHPGYVEDVKEERQERTREVFIAPREVESYDLMNKIFTEKLTKEFSQEFRNRFGHTEFEQLEFTTSRVAEATDSGRQVQFNEYREKQEEFGRFMAKELTEYHVDNYLRGNKNTREVYKVKEKISNVQVQTKSGYKIKIRYKLTTNRVRLGVEKPNEKFHKSIDAKLNGDELTTHLSYDVSRTVSVGTDWDMSNDIVSVRGVKRITAALSTSITGQNFEHKIGATPKQQRLLLGLSWAD